MKIEFVIGVALTTAFLAVVELFYRADTSAIWEVLKLIVQFSGALTIAWFTVRWALGRFKSEKTWERQITNYADVVSSLREMKRILDQYYDDEIKSRNFTEAYLDKLSERNRGIRDRFQEASSLAAIIQPRDISEVILKLEADLADGNYDSRFDAIDNELHLVSTALETLVSKRDRFV